MNFLLNIIQVQTRINIFFHLALCLLDQRRQVQYLPPILLRFNLPVDYPSKSPPTFQLECIWMIDEQVKSPSPPFSFDRILFDSVTDLIRKFE